MWKEAHCFLKQSKILKIKKYKNTHAHNTQHKTQANTQPPTCFLTSFCFLLLLLAQFGVKSCACFRQGRLYQPENEDQLQRLLRWATEAKQKADVVVVFDRSHRLLPQINRGLQVTIWLGNGGDGIRGIFPPPHQNVLIQV